MQLVSVIIPAFNQGQFLGEAIESVLKQTYQIFEIWIVDDGSTDDTKIISEQYLKRDSRIHYIYQSNQGEYGARNTGISNAKGIFIALLDSDDLMHPQRLELQIAEFKNDPQIDIVFTALDIIDKDGKKTGELRSRDYKPNDFLVQMFFRNIIPGPSTIMAKRQCLGNEPYNKSYRYAGDYELMIRLAHHYHFKYLDIPLTYYRRHENNSSNNLTGHRDGELKVLKQYDKEHIEKIVDSSFFNQEERKFIKGKIFFNMEHWADALETFEQVDDSLADFYRGNCYIKLNQVDKAIEAYESAVKKDKNNAAAFNNLGVVYGKDHISNALKAFESALQLKSDYIDANKNTNLLKSDQIPIHFTFKELRKDLLPYKII